MRVFANGELEWATPADRFGLGFLSMSLDEFQSAEWPGVRAKGGGADGPRLGQRSIGPLQNGLDVLAEPELDLVGERETRG